MRNNVFITYRHLRNNPEKNDQGGVTLAIWVDLRDPENRIMRFGYAMCRPDEAFDKKIGRSEAYARLAVERKYNVRETIVPFLSNGNTIVGQILDFINREDKEYFYKDLNRYLNRNVY